MQSQIKMQNNKFNPYSAARGEVRALSKTLVDNLSENHECLYQILQSVYLDILLDK